MTSKIEEARRITRALTALTSQARKAKLDTLHYLLSMAALEASRQSRNQSEIVLPRKKRLV